MHSNYDHHVSLTITEYQCHRWSKICSICHSQIRSFTCACLIIEYDLSPNILRGEPLNAARYAYPSWESEFTTGS